MCWSPLGTPSIPTGARSGSPAPRQPDGRFAGQYFFSTGTPFQSIAGSQASLTTTALGNTSFEFAADGRLTFTFTPNGGAPASRSLELLAFVPNPPVCRFTSEPRTGAANFSDLWWNPAESGWGLTFIHQGDGMFVAWYTYAADGQPQWLTALMTRQADGTFRGQLNRPASGLPYTSTPTGPVTSFPLCRMCARRRSPSSMANAAPSRTRSMASRRAS